MNKSQLYVLFIVLIFTCLNGVMTLIQVDSLDAKVENIWKGAVPSCHAKS